MSNPNVMKGLTNELITTLMGNTRSKNVYGPKLMSFISDSDEAAINPAEVWPIEFGQKKVTALYQGFLNAAKAAELTDTILVKQYDGAVYLLHKERVALALNPEDAADVEADTEDNEGDTDTDS